MNIAVVVPVMKSGERGGAEALYKGLVRGLRETSNDVDRIDVLIDESSFDAILESYEKCANLDLHDYDLVISTKAPTYAVRHRNSCLLSPAHDSSVLRYVPSGVWQGDSSAISAATDDPCLG